MAVSILQHLYKGIQKTKIEKIITTIKFVQYKFKATLNSCKSEGLEKCLILINVKLII